MTTPLVYNQSQMYDSNLGGEYKPTAPTAPQPLSFLNQNLGSRSSESGLFKYMTPSEAGGSALGGINSGLKVNPQGTDPYAAAFDVLGGAAGGAATGFAAGGPIGALIGGGTGGLIGLGKAFFSVSANRKAARDQKKFAALAEEAQRKAIEREEKWKQINRMDSLRTENYNRTKSVVQQGWMDYQNKLTIMNNFMNQNTQARDELMKLLQPVGK